MSENIFEAIKSYLEGKEIPLSNLLQIATEGANAMTGRYNEFIAKMREIAAPHLVTALHHPVSTPRC